jgi:hypothetical protein
MQGRSKQALGWLIVLSALTLMSSSVALGAETAADRLEHGHLRYAIGARVGTSWGGVDLPARARPSVGLAYGRWKFGSVPSDQGLRFSGLFREPSLTYEAFQTARRSLGLSFRLHDLERKENWDGLPSGKTTLRGRLLFSYALTDQWMIATEITQDLQQRGDGTTAGLGLVRGIDLGRGQRLFLSTIATWATGDHWAGVYREQLDPANPPSSMFGRVGVGATWRRWFGSHWLAWTSLSAARPVADLARRVDTEPEYRLELGVKFVSSFEFRSRRVD